MPLSPKDSIGTGLAVGGVAFTVFNMSLPPLTDIRAADPENHDVFAAERTATWIAAGLVVGVSAMVGDATVFIIGGTTVVVLAWLYRHANEVSPVSGVATPETAVPGMVSPNDPQDLGFMDVGPMVDASVG